MGSGVFTRVWPYDDIKSAICSIYTLSTTRFKNREREKKRREREKKNLIRQYLTPLFALASSPIPSPSHPLPILFSHQCARLPSLWIIHLFFCFWRLVFFKWRFFFWLEKIRTSKNIQQHCLLLLRGEREQNGSKGLRASSGKNRSEGEGMKRIRQALWS